MENNREFNQEREKLYEVERNYKRKHNIAIGSLLTTFGCFSLAIYNAERGENIHKYYGVLAMCSSLTTWVSMFNLLPRNKEERRLEQKLIEEGRV